MKTKVKICGVTNIKDAINASWCGADLLGFVFFKKSRRYIDPRKAKKIIEILPPFILKVGLFVNEKVSRVMKVAAYCGLDFVQLHGDEDIGYLRKLKGLRLIKAIRIKNKAGLRNLDDLPCELILLDSYSAEKFGGTGRSFDWSLVKEIKKIKKPYVISGGLKPCNVGRAVEIFSPYAVDVSSGVEKSPGKKDKNLMKEFVKNAKK
jgi:phosphoribosylanthranilate isomerase